MSFLASLSPEARAELLALVEARARSGVAESEAGVGARGRERDSTDPEGGARRPVGGADGGAFGEALR